MGTEAGLALTGRRGAPRRFLEHGFQFQFPTLREAFANLYANK
jgi:NAD dependent epimerase/dehydratase family enzyme